MSLLTLDEVKRHLRYDTDDNDDYLNSLIATAEEVIKNHVDAFDEANPVFKQAGLLLIGFWDNQRNAEEDNTNEWFLPKPVLMLLTPYRTPL